MSPPSAITFDLYGTLVDWEAGLGTFLYDLCRRAGETEPPPGRELRERWEEIQFELLSGSYRSYGEILSDSLRTWCGERGMRWNEKEGHALAHAMMCWQPFPDAIPSLQAAGQKGFRLGIVSNTDSRIVEHTLRQLDPIAFEQVVVAQDVSAYKPEIEPFTHMLDLLDLAPGEVLHVAFGFRYDIETADRLGLQTAWVNRRRAPAPGGARADQEWNDLWPLTELDAPAAR